MHWLSERVARVRGLSAAPSEVFLPEIDALVGEAGRRPGIRAAFATHEGLLVATAGSAEDFEELGALTQRFMEAATAADLLGELEQAVLVGARAKVAVVRIGPVFLGLVSDLSTSIYEATGPGDLPKVTPSE